jgi:hypothetical protein
MSKKQRGRLKKLRKRVQEVKEGCDISGITSMEDFQEMIELDGTLEIGPAVRLRNTSSYGGAYQRADGVDHRSILCQFLQRTNQTKKRVREDLTIPIPPWTTLHNPVAAKSLVVIEIHWKTCPESWIDFIANVPILAQLLEKKHSKYSALPVETRWFQGPSALSISDTLMYIPRSQSSAKPKKKKMKTADLKTPLEKLPPLLKALLMKPSQLAKEGYPLVDEKKMAEQPRSCKAISELSEDLCLPNSISSDDATKRIEQLQVPILPVNRREGDGRPFVQTVALQGEDQPSIFALDCEMVMSEYGQELARVTLIELQDVHGETNKVSYQVIMDELVKPDRPVLDYKTGTYQVQTQSTYCVR